VVRSTKRLLNELTLPGAVAIRSDAQRFRLLVASDPAKDRAAVWGTPRWRRSWAGTPVECGESGPPSRRQ
jgi:hypothetical protein